MGYDMGYAEAITAAILIGIVGCGMFVSYKIGVGNGKYEERMRMTDIIRSAPMSVLSSGGKFVVSYVIRKLQER